MALWGKTDALTSVPKWLETDVNNTNKSNDADNCVFVDVTEAGVDANRAKGIKTPGWNLYSNAGGRHRSEILVAMKLSIEYGGGGGVVVGRSFSETSSPPSFDGTDTISFGIRSQMLTLAFPSFNVGDSISFVIDGTTYTTTISQITGSNADPMFPIPFTIVVASGEGAPSGTVTLFTVADSSGIEQSSYTTNIEVDSMSGKLSIVNLPIDPNLAATIASIPIGATIVAHEMMGGGSSEFTLTSAFTLASGQWQATFNRDSGSGNNFNGFTVTY